MSVSVGDIDRSTSFYTSLFGEEPTIRKDDYAKWMLDDPRINFSINSGSRHRGLDHVGFQVDSLDELEGIRERVRDTQKHAVDQADAQCCYAESTKTWVRDPDSVVWEMFVTHSQITDYGDDHTVDEIMQDSETDNCCQAGNDHS